MELKRIPKNTVTTREEHWCHLRNAKSIGVPKSTQDESHFPFIESIAVSHSALYTTSVLTSFTTRKEPRFAWLNSRESTTRLSQDEKNTDVTSGTQNWLGYPKSTHDESHFPFIESIAVSHSTSYTTSVLTSFTTIQRFPETPISSL